MRNLYLEVGVVATRIKQPTPKPEPRYATLEQIEQAVTAVIPIPFEQVKGRSRLREAVIPRHIYAKLAYDHCTLTVETIGDYIGKDHATILHGNRSSNNQIETDRIFKNLYFKCLNELRLIVGCGLLDTFYRGHGQQRK